MRIWLPVVAISVVVAMAAPAAAYNLLSNGGFEDASNPASSGMTLDEWYEINYDGTDAYQSSALVHSGTYSAHLGSPAPDHAGGTNWLYQRKVPIIAGEDYSFSVYLANDSNAPISNGAWWAPIEVDIQYLNAAGSNLTKHTTNLYEADFAATDTFYQFAVNSTADATAAHAEVRIKVTGGGTYPWPPYVPKEWIYADDAHVESIYEPLAAPYAGEIQISKGNQILLDKGLQISTTVHYPFFNPATGQWDSNAPFNWTQLSDGNFTQVLLAGFSTQMGLPAGQNWTLKLDSDATSLTPEQQPYVDDLVSLQWRDEQWMGQPEWRDRSADWFADARASGDFDDVILYTNQYGRVSNWTGGGNMQYGGSDDEHMREYMRDSQPDMLYFDYYPFGSDPAIWGHPEPTYIDRYYGCLARYRKLSLEGNDGTGETPIPFGVYLEAYTDDNRRDLSESQMRLNQFAAWAFGAKHATHFLYNSCDPAWGNLRTTLFDWNGESDPESYTDANPSTEFAYAAESNRRSLNLGDSLVRLITTDARLIEGQYKDPNGVTRTTGVDEECTVWDSSADPYITAIAATNLGAENDGLDGEVIVGYFNVIDEALDGAPEDELYFMLVNGLSTVGGLCADTQQSIHLEFDMGASGISRLLRLSSDTGYLTYVPMVSDGGSIYHLDLTLDGGSGDLFKFDTGAEFVGAGFYPGDCDGDGDVDNVDFGALYGAFTGPGSFSKTWEEGDFDGDGDVDNVDFGVLYGNYTGPLAGGMDMDLQVTPEPATLALLGLGGVALLRRRHI